MAFSKVLKGSECKVYISGKLFAELDSIRWNINYGKSEIYGIDSVYPQEIPTTRISVQGSASGFKVKLVDGLQEHAATFKINQILYAPYTTLKIVDRKDNILLYIPQMTVTDESVQIISKTSVKFSFNFKGIIPYNTSDLK